MTATATTPDVLPLTAAHAAAVAELELARAAAREIDAQVDALPADEPTPDALSDAVDAAADHVLAAEAAELAARTALYHSPDEPCEYTLRDGQSGVSEIILADSDKHARKQAREWARDGYQHSGEGGTWWVDVHVIDLLGDSECVTVTIDPDEPDCAAGCEHEWCSPIEVVGGIAENPGVWGHGGGVTIREVCSHCGCYRETDTWAQRPDTGEQGLQSVAYEPADDDSLAWVDAQREESRGDSEVAT